MRILFLLKWTMKFFFNSGTVYFLRQFNFLNSFRFNCSVFHMILNLFRDMI